MKPLITVIMNCYNGERFLRKSINSVLDQTYKNIELIFWDNISTDNSAEIVKSFKDKRIRYFKGKKFTNLYNARNLAIKKAKGQFVSFLDVDDWWKKTKIQKQFELYKKNFGRAQLIYSNCYLYNNKLQRKKLFIKSKLPEGKITQELLNNYCVSLLTIFIKKKIFLKESFNKKYNIIGDFDFITRISDKINFACVQEPLAYYRIHENNYSTKQITSYILELKNWLTKNNKSFKKRGFSTLGQLSLLYKLKLKKKLSSLKLFLNYLGV